jgi:hypothetical protein
MGNEATAQAEVDKQILRFDVPDDVLERAGKIEYAFTMFYCTNQAYGCGLH